MSGADGRAGGHRGADRAPDPQVKAVLDETLEKIPEMFNMAEIMAKAAEKTPYVVVAFQECERMNILTNEMRRSLKELSLGLKVQARGRLGPGAGTALLGWGPASHRLELWAPRQAVEVIWTSGVCRSAGDPSRLPGAGEMAMPPAPASVCPVGRTDHHDRHGRPVHGALLRHRAQHVGGPGLPLHDGPGGLVC